MSCGNNCPSRRHRRQHRRRARWKQERVISIDYLLDYQSGTDDSRSDRNRYASRRMIGHNFRDSELQESVVDVNRVFANYCSSNN
jgi:hypothetical protein